MQDFLNLYLMVHILYEIKNLDDSYRLGTSRKLKNYFLCFVGPTLTFSTTVVLGCDFAQSVVTNLPVPASLAFSTVFDIAHWFQLILCGGLPVPLRYTLVLHTYIYSSSTSYVILGNRRNIHLHYCSVSLPLLQLRHYQRSSPNRVYSLQMANTCNLWYVLHALQQVARFC